MNLIYATKPPWAEGKDTEVIVLDYATWVFGGFGFCYALMISSYEYIVFNHSPSFLFNSLFFMVGLIICVAIPVLGVMAKSYKKYGHFGIKPCSRS